MAILDIHDCSTVRWNELCYFARKLGLKTGRRNGTEGRRVARGDDSTKAFQCHSPGDTSSRYELTESTQPTCHRRRRRSSNCGNWVSEAWRRNVCTRHVHRSSAASTAHHVRVDQSCKQFLLAAAAAAAWCLADRPITTSDKEPSHTFQRRRRQTRNARSLHCGFVVQLIYIIVQFSPRQDWRVCYTVFQIHANRRRLYIYIYIYIYMYTGFSAVFLWYQFLAPNK